MSSKKRRKARYILIGEEIRELRKQKKMSQAEFGSLLGIKGNTLSDIELGKRGPTKRLLMLLESRYGISLSDEPTSGAGDLRPGDKPPASTGSEQIREESARAYLVPREYEARLLPYIDILVEILASGNEMISEGCKQSLIGTREIVRAGKQSGITSKKAYDKAGEK